LFERFTDRARRVVVLAQEEARLLNHNYIGTEHILLGLIHEGEGVAAKALESLGISLEKVRQQVEEIIGAGQSPPSGHIPFTPRAKKVLEIALREAKHLNHNYIGTEHVLLGIIREGEGVAAQALEALGAGEFKLRAAVIAAMKGLSAAKSGASISASAQAPACSFCEKPRDAVKTLVAGPGPIAICDECIDLALDVVRVSTLAEDPRTVRLSDVVMDEIATKGADADLAARVAEVEERLRKLEEPPEA
jgi:ATP-dependent Clp protease ATP-binding subunit ClpA